MKVWAAGVLATPAIFMGGRSYLLELVRSAKARSTPWVGKEGSQEVERGKTSKEKDLLPKTATERMGISLCFMYASHTIKRKKAAGGREDQGTLKELTSQNVRRCRHAGKRTLNGYRPVSGARRRKGNLPRKFRRGGVQGEEMLPA